MEHLTEDLKYDQARAVVDSIIHSGKPFTLDDLYNSIEKFMDERVEWISEYTSVKAYVNDLLSLRIIVPLPTKNGEERKYMLKKAVKVVKVK